LLVGQVYPVGQSAIVLQTWRDSAPLGEHADMHFVPSGCVAPEAPQQSRPLAHSVGEMHSTVPPSAQSASAAQLSSGTAPVRCAQQNWPLGQLRPQAALVGAPLLDPVPPPLELDPVVVPLSTVFPPLLLLLELGPVGPVELFEPQPPEANASAAARPAPTVAKNSTCAFLMGKP
jgi:hypothetical protein